MIAHLSCVFQQIVCSRESMFQCSEVKNLIAVFIAFIPDKNIPLK